MRNWYVPNALSFCREFPLNNYINNYFNSSHAQFQAQAEVGWLQPDELSAALNSLKIL
jgi:hypothetical protein